MQIALSSYCKIEFGVLSKDSITEKNSAIAADVEKLSYNVLNLDSIFCEIATHFYFITGSCKFVRTDVIY